jgi:non-specific serine/threonine protein kinase
MEAAVTEPARRALGERAEAARAEGAHLTLDEAVEEALSGLPEPAVIAPAEADAPARPAGLSERELEVAYLVAQGLTNRRIAERLRIAERTAEGHVERVRRKLGVRSRRQVAVAMARLRPWR